MTTRKSTNYIQHLLLVGWVLSISIGATYVIEHLFYDSNPIIPLVCLGGAITCFTFWVISLSNNQKENTARQNFGTVLVCLGALPLYIGLYSSIFCMFKPSTYEEAPIGLIFALIGGIVYFIGYRLRRIRI